MKATQLILLVPWFLCSPPLCRYLSLNIIAQQWPLFRKGRHLSPGAAFWGSKLRLECYVAITKCRMSADASKHDLQNVECHSLIASCKISSRSPKFAKRAITNLSDASKASLGSPATSARMWFDWRLRHNAFR